MGFTQWILHSGFYTVDFTPWVLHSEFYKVRFTQLALGDDPKTDTSSHHSRLHPRHLAAIWDVLGPLSYQSSAVTAPRWHNTTGGGQLKNSYDEKTGQKFCNNLLLQLYSVYSILYIEHCTLYTVHCTLSWYRKITFVIKKTKQKNTVIGATRPL